MSGRYALQGQLAWPDGLEAELEKHEVIEDGGWYRSEVQAGRLALAMISDTEERRDLCHILYRLEAINERIEFVAVGVVAVDPSRRGVDVTNALVESCTLFALAQQCSSLRVHTARPGLVLKLCEHGFEAIETVLQKTIAEAV